MNQETIQIDWKSMTRDDALVILQVLWTGLSRTEYLKMTGTEAGAYNRLTRFEKEQGNQK